MESNLVVSGCNSFARVFEVLCVSIPYKITHGVFKRSVKVTEMATMVWVRRLEAPKDLKRAHECSEWARESPAGA